MRDSFLRVAVVLSVLGAASCAYGPFAPRPEAEPVIALCQDRTLPTKPFAHSTVNVGDTEGIVHVPGDDDLWLGDDHSDTVFEFDRRTGHYRSRITAADIVKAFPAVGQCDDGDQDPRTQCSYVGELEVLAYDPASGTLFVFNTVNNPNLDPPVDKAAVFRLRKKHGRGPFRLVDWRELSGGQNGQKYGPAAVIDGKLYLAIRNQVVEYDLGQNRLADTDQEGNPRPLVTTTEGAIAGMAYDGSSLWLLTSLKKLVRVDWKAKQVVGSYDVAPFEISRPKGLAFGAGEFFLVDGNDPHLIHVLHFGTRKRLAWWRGGGPSLSCG